MNIYLGAEGATTDNRSHLRCILTLYTKMWNLPLLKTGTGTVIDAHFTLNSSYKLPCFMLDIKILKPAYKSKKSNETSNSNRFNNFV